MHKLEPAAEHTPTAVWVRISAWCVRHWPPVVLAALILAALPFYLDAAALQLLDNEFFSALCGFVGWGRGAGS